MPSEIAVIQNILKLGKEKNLFCCFIGNLRNFMSMTADREGSSLIASVRKHTRGKYETERLFRPYP